MPFETSPKIPIYLCLTCFVLMSVSWPCTDVASFFFFCFSSLPSGFEENLEVQGELILQDSFQVWDPRSLIRKGRDRHLFLFEFSLVFSKEIKDSAGRTKYQYKNRLLVGVLLRAILIMFMLKCSRCVASGHQPTDLGCFIL